MVYCRCLFDNDLLCLAPMRNRLEAISRRCCTHARTRSAISFSLSFSSSFPDTRCFNDACFLLAVDAPLVFQNYISLSVCLYYTIYRRIQQRRCISNTIRGSSCRCHYILSLSPSPRVAHTISMIQLTPSVFFLSTLLCLFSHNTGCHILPSRSPCTTAGMIGPLARNIIYIDDDNRKGYYMRRMKLDDGSPVFLSPSVLFRNYKK